MMLPRMRLLEIVIEIEPPLSTRARFASFSLGRIVSDVESAITGVIVVSVLILAAVIRAFVGGDRLPTWLSVQSLIF